MTDGLEARTEARLASGNLTPMMRQYLTVKSEHPGAIVLFRMGDFFETFFEDAEECARRLDITLTARSKERDIPMAGVPHHAIEGYLSRLVEQGCTVIIVDQVEDPRQAKGLVRREVTRIVTPGTYVDPTAPARVPNHLVSLDVGRSRRRIPGWALATLDLGTGDFRATEGEGEELLVDELSRLDPKELLIRSDQTDSVLVGVAHNALPSLLLTRLDDADFSDAQAEGALDTVLGVEERTALAAQLGAGALRAAGRALGYALRAQARTAPDLRGRASLDHVRALRPYVPGEALVLDREARAHLELFRTTQGETRGSLLKAIDRAITPMGGRRIAEWLAYPSRDGAEIGARHAAVGAFCQNASALDAVRDHLSVVSDLERLLGRVVLGRALPRDLVQLREGLEQVRPLFEHAEVASRGVPELVDGPPESPRLAELAATDPCVDVCTLLEQALEELPANDPTAGAVMRTGWDEELDGYADVAAHGKERVEALQARERELTGIPSLKVKLNKVFGYYIEVTKTNLSLVPDRYVRKQTTVNSERYFTDELKELEDQVLNAEERRVERTKALYAELLARVGAEADRLGRLAAAVAELDVLSGFAHLAEAMDWCRPELHEGYEIDIVEGRHPVLEQLVGELGERFVPNDVRLDGEERLMIITGPNMAGKSTIMRQTALIVILAHMGSYVPARSARIGKVGRVLTRVGAGDDLSRGRSTFMMEMVETSRILRSAAADDLVILDEIGRGTSTFDGLSIAWAVAEHLHDVVQARVMFATHYHELTELARTKERAVNRHVAVREHDEDIVFLRKLAPGATNRSYGVQVARLAGLPAPVVQRARQVLDGLEAQALQTGQSAEAAPDGGPPSPRGRQLPLFVPARDPRTSGEADPRVRKLTDALEAVDVDELTPRKALDLVAQLQSLLRAQRR